LRDEEEMKFKPHTAVAMVSTRISPLHIRDQNGADGWQDPFRTPFFEDPSQGIRLMMDLDDITQEELARLVKGEELRTPFGFIENAGKVRLVRGEENGILTMVFLEFLPNQPVETDLPFHAWFELRFPQTCGLRNMKHEPWWMYFHQLWIRETRMESTLTPDDALLCQAVINNQEHFLEAILAAQPRIEVPPGLERFITETALVIAMKHTGMFDVGRAPTCDCRRSFHHDDSPGTEKSATWKARAKRIAKRLVAAGAKDYTPLFDAIRAPDANQVKALLKAGFPPNFMIHGHTKAMCEAVHAGDREICYLLLDHGADPNVSSPFFYGD